MILEKLAKGFFMLMLTILEAIIWVLNGFNTLNQYTQ